MLIEKFVQTVRSPFLFVDIEYAIPKYSKNVNNTTIVTIKTCIMFKAIGWCSRQVLQNSVIANKNRCTYLASGRLATFRRLQNYKACWKPEVL